MGLAQTLKPTQSNVVDIAAARERLRELNHSRLLGLVILKQLRGIGG